MEKDCPTIVITLTQLKSIPGLSLGRVALIHRAFGLIDAPATRHQHGFRKQAASIQQAEPA